MGGESVTSVTRSQYDARPTVTYPATNHHRPLAIPNYTAWQQRHMYVNKFIILLSNAILRLTFSSQLTPPPRCFTPSCTGSMFRSGSSISSEWQFTGVSKAGLPSTPWTAATPHRVLPVVSDFDLPAPTISSYHDIDIIAARSADGRSPSPVRWPGTRCLTTSETRRSVPTFSERG